MDTCILNASHHSEDLTEVWHGEDTPLIACGFHVESVGVNELARLKREGQPVWALWHGGPNYTEPYLENHLEIFESHDAALGALSDREHRGHWQQQDVRYANDLAGSYAALFPNVERSRIEIFFADPRESDDGSPIPDERWSLDADGDPCPYDPTDTE